MQKEIITLFAKYNKSVNEAMNGIIKTLSPEEWEKPLGSFFPSFAISIGSSVLGISGPFRP